MRNSSAYMGMAVAALFTLSTNAALGAASEDLQFCACASINDEGTGLDFLTAVCDGTVPEFYDRTRLRAPKSGEIYPEVALKDPPDGVGACTDYINGTAACVNPVFAGDGPREPYVRVGSPAALP